MSSDDLKAQGLLLPEELWGKLDLHTSVRKLPLLLTFGLAGVAVVLMIGGGGEILTWVGALLFIAFLVLFTLVSSNGIDRQTKRVQAVLGKSKNPGESS